MGDLTRRHSQEERNRKKEMRSTAFVLLTLSVTCIAIETGLKAASGQVNCACQCSVLTFRDKYGNLNGDCKSTDKGAKWCYVDPQYRNCGDLKPSTRNPGKYWTYEGCATPSLNSPQCRYFNNGNNGNYNNGNTYPCRSGTKRNGQYGNNDFTIGAILGGSRSQTGSSSSKTGSKTTNSKTGTKINFGR